MSTAFDRLQQVPKADDGSVLPKAWPSAWDPDAWHNKLWKLQSVDPIQETSVSQYMDTYDVTTREEMTRGSAHNHTFILVSECVHACC